MKRNVSITEQFYSLVSVFVWNDSYFARIRQVSKIRTKHL